MLVHMAAIGRPAIVMVIDDVGGGAAEHEDRAVAVGVLAHVLAAPLFAFSLSRPKGRPLVGLKAVALNDITLFTLYFDVVRHFNPTGRK